MIRGLGRGQAFVAAQRELCANASPAKANTASAAFVLPRHASQAQAAAPATCTKPAPASHTWRNPQHFDLRPRPGIALRCRAKSASSDVPASAAASVCQASARVPSWARRSAGEQGECGKHGQDIGHELRARCGEEHEHHAAPTGAESVALEVLFRLALPGARERVEQGDGPGSMPASSTGMK